MTTTETKIKKPKVVKKTAVTKTTKIAKKSKVSPKKEKSVHISGSDSKVVLRIRVRAYESKILDASIKQIMDTAMRYDAVIVGPVPLPTEIKKYTVNRSPFIYKNTREQFEIRVHKRLIYNINQSFVHSYFELFSRIFVDKGCAINSVFFYFCR